MKLISCDIDGILNNYPQCWLEYLAERCGILYHTVKDAKNYEPLYKEYKMDYRRSECKATLKVSPEGRALIDGLSQKGYTILMATSRPMLDANYPELFKLTENWLKNNNIPFSELVFKDYNVSFIDRFPDLLFHIEDDLKYAEPCTVKGIKVFLYTKHLKTPSPVVFPTNIIAVDNLLHILSYV